MPARASPSPPWRRSWNWSKGRAHLAVELKQPEAAPALLAFFRKHQAFDAATVISFWHPAVKALKEAEPRLQTGVLMVGCPADPAGLARAARADTLVLNYRYVNRELVEAAHRQEIGVIVWNIDDPEILEPYLAMNLEAICTNRPREIITKRSGEESWRSRPPEGWHRLRPASAQAGKPVLPGNYG